MNIQMLLALIGTVAGVIYAILGITAIKHIKDGPTSTDKAVGWSLWWWIERQRYDSRGQKICSIGGVVFAIGVASWVLWLNS